MDEYSLCCVGQFSNLNIVKFHDQVHQLFFPDEDSRKKALECGPWCFDNYLFIIKPWDPAMKTPNYEFKSILTVFFGLVQYERLSKLCFRCGNWDHTLLSSEKDKQEYGLWMALLVTVDLDDSCQIKRINNIRADCLEKPVPGHQFTEVQRVNDEQQNNSLQRRIIFYHQVEPRKPRSYGSPSRKKQAPGIAVTLKQ
ncbi:hypothetical protein M9H77_34592 [Catharanthus roseus]|uniref:Uncharacterized protein n=1 Tax=Catharanthus roseus TaxID=4058 RepID=A0ACB9ZQU9_CATRO|nr:hypothetical protein M9H77_34592 [Catharanthus roseus]